MAVEQEQLNKGIDPEQLEVGDQVRGGYSIVGLENETLTITLRRIEQNEQGIFSYAFGVGTSKQDYMATMEDILAGRLGEAFTLNEIIKSDPSSLSEVPDLTGPELTRLIAAATNFKP